MQIDFHHTVTYVCARLAGFHPNDAEVIAYSAQYVDDATNSGTIKFDNGAMYHRIASAHKVLDYRNFDKLKNHQVWIPFHFLPGNGGLEAGDNPDGSFIRKLVCKPNSYVAQDMVDACLADKNKPYGLHRLGITMHVYADTWAHQQFAGVNHKINNVKLLSHDNSKIEDFFGDLFDDVKNRFISKNFPLGHGAALSFPDKPYLKWEYENGFGEVIPRDNTDIFLDAAENMIRVMTRYNESSHQFSASDKGKMKELFLAFTSEEGEDRHKSWLGAISDGAFSFGAEDVSYTPKGAGSWKHLAIGTKKIKDNDDDIFIYTPEFLTSDWKRFHDALQAHRFDVLHDILPKYGISAA